MNKTKRVTTSKIAFLLCTALLGALTGCVGYVHGPRHERVYVPPPAVEVAASVEFGIRAESDFYEPLTSYGRWEVVGSYGRCWIPGRVDSDWRPYSDGYWQRTDAGWYWASEEPWAWATYHYGRWDFSAQFGWYWVPQTQWAPAWVSWHSGGGYIGWAPLYPSARFVRGGSLEVDVRVISPRAYVFVEQRHFLEPVRHSTVVVNNTTIINKTVNITNTKVVNNTVINEGPRTQIIEQASGHKVQAVPVRELRRKHEAEVVARQGATPRTSPEKLRAPVRSEGEPRATKPRLESERRAKEAEALAQEQLQRSAKDAERATQLEPQRRAKEAAAKVQKETQRNAKGLENKAQQESERRARDAERKAQDQLQRSAQDAEKATQVESQRRAKEVGAKAHEESQRNARGLEKKAQQVSKQPAKERPVASEKGGTKTVKKVQKPKGKGTPSPPENSTVPPPASP